MHLTDPRILAAAILAASYACAGADVVETKAGDRIVGEISSRDESFIHVTSPTLGEINVPLDSVAKVVEDEAAKESAAQKKAAPPPPPPPEPPKTWAETVFGYLDVFPEWKSNLSFGLSYLSGQTDSHSSAFSFDTERKWTDDELRFEITQNYEVTTDDDGTDDVSQDNFKALGRFRHNMSERLFALSETQYSYNNVKGIDRDIRESLGIGWRVIKGEKLNLTLSPAMTVQHQVVEGETLDLLYSPTLFEELTYDLSEGTSFRQNASYMFPLNDTDEVDPSYSFSLSVKHMLSRIISLNFSYLYDYDGSVEEGTEAGQQTVNLMLGVSF